jgi:membrane protein YqaA with SNARE-associated domain
MPRTCVLLTSMATHPLVALALASKGSGKHLLPLLFHFGLLGLGLVSVVDSSFIPLPLPGVTDIMLVLYAAGHANPILLVTIATAGSALGGFLSHAVGQAGGMAFLEKRVSARLLKRVTTWVEEHSIIAIALPAILPPPVPLSPFVLVAGAVHMSRRKFMTAFTASRLLRHIIAVWLGIRYGTQVLHIWNRFSAKWAVTILIVFWSVTLVFTAIGIWKLVQTSRSVGLREGKAPGQPAPHST